MWVCIKLICHLGIIIFRVIVKPGYGLRLPEGCLQNTKPHISPLQVLIWQVWGGAQGNIFLKCYPGSSQGSQMLGSAWHCLGQSWTIREWKVEEKIGNLLTGVGLLLRCRANAFSARVGICPQTNKWNPHLHRSLPVWLEMDLGPGKQSSSSSNRIMKMEQ